MLPIFVVFHKDRIR
jgi:hypothetical protein